MTHLLSSTDNNSYWKQKLIVVAAIIVKAIVPDVITSCNFKVSAFLSSNGVLRQFTLLQRFGITTSYNYFANIRVNSTSQANVNAHMEEVDKASERNDLLITGDNVQKEINTSAVGTSAKAKVKICFSALVWQLQNQKFCIQEQTSLQSLPGHFIKQTFSFAE